MRRKRSLGLYFSCDERYTPGHKCRKPQLLLMEGGSDDEEEEEPVDNREIAEPEISVNAIMGWDSPKTVWVQIEVKRQQIIALIDSGSTHNFISERVANRIGLRITPTTPFKVRVADGHPLSCKGAYREVSVQIAGQSFDIDLFALPLSGLDVVLGICWLETLGLVICDWKAQTLLFNRAGRSVRL